MTDQEKSKKQESPELESKYVEDFAVGSDASSELHKTSEQTESHHKYEGSKQISFGDVASDGSVSHSFEGKSRQNETGILEVCGILIRRLNRDGSNWSNLKDLSNEVGSVDCRATDGSSQLNIQVTRSEEDGGFWARIRNIGQATNAYQTKEEAADALRDVIKKKSDRYALSDKKQILLALDATETTSHALETVVNTFRVVHGNWAKSRGFSSIWVVGPNPELTHRLDS